MTLRGGWQDKEPMIDGKKVFKDLHGSADAEGYVAVWRIPSDSPYFEGHFPGNPIFPAVGIVDATLYFLRSQIKGPEIFVSHFPVAKFLSPIQPGQTVRIEVKKLSSQTEIIQWQAEWKDEGAGKLLATLRFHL